MQFYFHNTVSFITILLINFAYSSQSVEYIQHNLPGLNQNVSLQINSNSKFYLQAETDIKHGEPFLKISGDLIHSVFDTFPREYFFRGMLRPGLAYDPLVGFLLFTEFITKEGQAYDYYIKSGVAENNKSLYKWKNETFLFYQKYHGYHNGPHITSKNLATIVQRFITANMKYLDKYEPKFVKEMFEIDKIKEKLQIAYSNLFTVTKWSICELRNCDKKTTKVLRSPGNFDNFTVDEVSTGIFPYIEMLLNERPLNFNNIPLSYILERNRTKYMELLGYKDKNEKIKFDLKFDSLNIYDDVFFHNIQYDDASKYIKVEKNQVLYLSNKNYKKGDKISYTYGYLSNFELLSKFGFFDPLNPYDSMIHIENSRVLHPNEIELLNTFALGKKGTGPNNTVDYIFDFHRNQINHDYLFFCLIKSVSTMSTASFLSLEDATKILKKEVNTPPAVQAYSYYLYFSAADYSEKWEATALETLEKLAELEKSTSEQDAIKLDILELGIVQKMNLFRHMKWASKKLLKSTFESLFQQEISMKFILAAANPESSTLNQQPVPQIKQKINKTNILKEKELKKREDAQAKKQQLIEKKKNKSMADASNASTEVKDDDTKSKPNTKSTARKSSQNKVDLQ